MTHSITNYSVLDGKYKVHGTIGAGGFGKVKKGIHVVTGEKVAIKVMDKRTLGDDLPRAKLEIEALKHLHHQHICKMYDVIETETKIFMVLEHCSGGEMFDYIVERDRLKEAEARFFFRQIVAAVAYIHSQGFAHRDLKPENLLLDEEQNIKLIDFGLCARPKGGMGVQLETFCGSPAYAAPELITGKEYLGSEADMWSLGILLFTLLCGYLPFDDDNMGTLYRKIQMGSYECPLWLSEESKHVINKMLQTDPKRRITVGSLLIHPWLNQGCGPRPIHWRSNYDKEDLDDEVISELALYFGKSKRSIYEELRQWKYDYLMSTYFLLLLKKKKGNFIALSCNKTPLKVCQRPNWELSSSLESGLNDADLLLLASPKRDSTSFEKSVSSSSEDSCKLILSDHEHHPNLPPPASDSSDKENFIIPACPPSTKRYRPKTPSTPAKGSSTEKHARSDTPATAIVRKVPRTPSSTRHHHLSGEALNQFESPSLFPPIEKRCRSVDMDASGHPISIESVQECSMPVGGAISGSGTPSKGNSARQRVFGSIERRMDKVRNMLTPKKKGEPFAISRAASPAPLPRRLKVKPTGLFNVSVVGRSGKSEGVSAEAVLDMLQRALERKGIPCNRKGYILRNKIRNEQTGKVTLAFELEICLLQPPQHGYPAQSTDNPLLGVCRKRLKGDTWMYKNVVEEVLKVLNH